MQYKFFNKSTPPLGMYLNYDEGIAEEIELRRCLQAADGQATMGDEGEWNLITGHNQTTTFKIQGRLEKRRGK